MYVYSTLCHIMVNMARLAAYVCTHNVLYFEHCVEQESRRLNVRVLLSQRCLLQILVLVPWLATSTQVAQFTLIMCRQ